MKKNHYGQLQYIVQQFCRNAKFPFAGEKDVPYEIDLDEIPVMKIYIKEEKRNLLEKSAWLIEINFEQIKAMFDPVIERIIGLIKKQLDQNKKKCLTMFLVGGFSESNYLQTRIKDEFKEIKIINIL